ncbi:alpha/beta hydrolase [Sulfolobus tengchongensis]|uniref:Alpha/beta hydrolase n=1 Tax=Sulfolobus tengchongensis TaxID=207809 RepID=A0AAX4L4S8_9CREN
MEDVIGRYVNIDGLNIYYETVGDGHPIIMLHLAGFDGRVYRPLIPYFPRRYKLIIVDLPAHGKSDPWPKWQTQRVSLEYYANILVKLIDKLSLNPISVVGTSIGGDLSLLLGIKLGSRVKGIVSVNGAGKTRTFTERDIENSNNLDVGRTLRFAGDYATKRVIEYLTWIRGQNRNEILINDLFAWNNFDVMEELWKIEADVLLARGEFEPLVTEEMIKETASKIKKVRIETIKGVGHYAPVENPEEFSKVVVAFLDQVVK